MGSEKTGGKPTTRRYSAEEKAAAVRMVRSLRAETGMTQGTVRRVAQQLGYGVESVRVWVNQADVDEGVRLSQAGFGGGFVSWIRPRERGSLLACQDPASTHRS